MCTTGRSCNVLFRFYMSNDVRFRRGLDRNNFPCVTMLNWRDGSGTARFYVLKVRCLHAMHLLCVCDGDVVIPSGDASGDN